MPRIPRLLPLLAAPALVAGVLPGGALLAQQAASDSARALDPVVVTATRTPVARTQTPATVTVLNGAELRARGVVRLADALREVPGVAVVQGGSFGAVTSLFVRGANSNHLKVLVDGAPLNAPGGGFDFAHLTLDDVERIEVVRGPASVLYGSDALAGVVNVITRRGASRTQASLAARGGSFGTREAEASAAGAGAGLRWNAGGGHRRTDGVYDFNSAYRSTTLGGTVALAPHAAGDLRLQARYTDAEAHYPTDGSGRPVDRNQFTTDRRLVLSADGGRRLGDRLEGRLFAAATEIRTGSRNDPDTPEDENSGRARSRSYRRSVDARINAAADGAGVLTLGTQFERQQFSTDGVSNSAFGPFPLDVPAQHRTDLAAYVQLAGARVAFDWSLGARVDDNSAFGEFTTGRAGAGWRVPMLGARLRASIGNAFKEPAFDEQFNTTYSNGNRDLKPERVLTTEVGAEQPFAAGRLSLGVTWFDQRLRDLILYAYRGGPVGDGGEPADYLNGPRASARGVELELRAPRLPRGFSASASWVATRTRAEEGSAIAAHAYAVGQRLLRRPTHTGSVTLSWSRSGVGTLGAALYAAGTREDLRFNEDFTTDRVVLPGYATLDLSGEASLRPLARSFGAAALTWRVENALDKRFVQIVGYPAPGRRVLAGVRIGD